MLLHVSSLEKGDDHITPVLASLHWLPVVFRIKFKILLFTFKSLHGLAPKYLLFTFKSLHGLAPKYMSELVCIHAPSREIRSAQQMLLDVPRCRQKICPVYRPVQNATKDSLF
jgi:hypothetical protein